MPLPYLCIGHCCHDRHQGRNILGGTAAYVSLAARRLGMEAGVLTSVGRDFEFIVFFEESGIRICNKEAPRTTVFENIYQAGKRAQYLHARALTIFPEDVPPEWLSVPIVQFCPIADEVDFALLRAFPDALVGATIQGWLRQWDAEGEDISQGHGLEAMLAGVDVVILSDADIAGFEAALPEIAATVPVLVLTQGADGAIVFYENQKHHFPAYPVTEVDATGAGDVFAASFMIRYAETRDIALATGFAHCAASFVVEGLGISNLAGRQQIGERFERYRSIYQNTV